MYDLSFAQVVRILRTYTDLCAHLFPLRTYTAYLLPFFYGQSRGIRYCRFLNFFFPSECSCFIASLEDPILRVPSSYFSAQAARYYWNVSRIRFWGFFKVLCLRELLIIHRPILPWRFLVDIDRVIYVPDGVILLCTMLLCGSYI